MTEQSKPANRIGMHYFPDTTHYREQDLKTWLPELQALGASWLTVISPVERAIPEYFIQGLRDAGIEPVVHLPMRLDPTKDEQKYSILFENYARWGVRYLAPFDRPNIRRSWAPSGWVQADLVEHFLDMFIPIANMLLSFGIAPVFPPLEPGGDYWDTAFLQTTLRGMLRRGHQALLKALILGVYAWTFDRPLDWGKGGPECWPSTQPYFTPTGSQDQIGFRIFDWYQAIARTEINHSPPMIIMGAGSRLTAGLGSAAGGVTSKPDPSVETLLSQHADVNLAIARLIAANPQPKKYTPALEHNHLLSRQAAVEPEAIEQILCMNFWLLSSSTQSEQAADAWYQSSGNTLPVVGAIKQWNAQRVQSKNTPTRDSLNLPPVVDNAAAAHPIEHYLLLPLYAWGVADWDLEAIRPFLQQHHPTVGFSVYEARLANHVTIFGEAINLSQDTLTILRASGCEVDCIGQDGTLLAI